MHLHLVDQRYAAVRAGSNHMAVIPADLAKLVMRFERSGSAHDCCEELQQLCIVPPGYEEFCEPGMPYLSSSAIISRKVAYQRIGDRALAFFKLADRVDVWDLSQFSCVTIGLYYIYSRSDDELRILFVLGEHAEQIVHYYTLSIDGLFVVEITEPYILRVARVPSGDKTYLDLRSKTIVRD